MLQNDTVCVDEFPTELVKVTETVPMALLSPVIVNGVDKWNAAPLESPVALENHCGAIESRRTVNEVVPFSTASLAAPNAKVTLIRSRVVE